MLTIAMSKQAAWISKKKLATSVFFVYLLHHKLAILRKPKARFTNKLANISH